MTATSAVRDSYSVLVTSSDELAERCTPLGNGEFVAVDTEFVRENTYRPKPCLIQLSDPEGHAFAIDPIDGDLDLAPLCELLQNRRVLKVFHASRQDLEILYRISGKMPRPVFDTQVAAMVCGFGEQIGFAKLVRELCGVTLDKSSQFSDWSLRPLSPRQISYALDDVVHLCTIYEALRKRLEQNGRGRWLSEEMAILTDPATYDADPNDAWQRVRRRGLSGRGIAVLQKVAAWRERRAQRLDVPRTRILRDESVLEIASSAPRTLEALGRIRGVSGSFVASDAAPQLLAAIAEGLRVPASQLPKPAPRVDLPEGAEQLVALMQALLKLRCAQHGVAEKLIATRSDLEQIAVDSSANVHALRGWRREIFGAEALALKTGSLAITGTGKAIRVTRLRRQTEI